MAYILRYLKFAIVSSFLLVNAVDYTQFHIRSSSTQAFKEPNNSPLVRIKRGTNPLKTVADGRLNHYGKHFVVGFTEQYPASQWAGQVALTIVAIYNNTNVTVRTLSPKQSYSNFVFGAGQVVDIPLQTSLRMEGTKVEQKGIEVISSKDIAITCTNYDDTTADAYLALPTNALGRIYVVASYEPADKSTIGIISWYGETSIRIRFKTKGTIWYRQISYGNSKSLKITLGRLQTFHISHKNDLSGTIIEASKPIAVISGNTCSFVGFGACDLLAEFLLPVHRWGKEFLFASTLNMNKKYGDIFRVFAYENETTVYHRHGKSVLSSGKFLQVDVKGTPLASFINCDKPCQIVEYVKGRPARFQGQYIDCSMIILPSVEQFLPSYRVVLPVGSFYNHSVTLFIKGWYKNGLIMDGTLLNNLDWQSINDTEYVWTVLRLPDSRQSPRVIYHSSSGVTFGLLVFGGTTHRSYGYPGGFSFNDAQNATNTTSPNSSTTPSKDSCKNELVRTSWGSFVWPETQLGDRAVVPCPHNKSVSATRNCSISPQEEIVWGQIDAHACPYLNEKSRKIFEISKEPINSTNLILVCEQITNLTFPGEKLIPDDVTNVAAALESITRVTEKVDEVADDVLKTIDNILDANIDVITKSQEETKSTGRILDVLNNLLEDINITKDGFKRDMRNFAVDLSIVHPSSFQGATYSLGKHPKDGISDRSKMVTNQISTEEKTSSTSEITSIHLPKTLFADSAKNNLSRAQALIFTLYKEAKFFGVNSSKKTNSSLRLNSYVIGASIKRHSIQNLKNPIVISYERLQNGDVDTALCVFWSFSTGEWSNEGCKYHSTDVVGRIVCHCDHLTNFAMLMDMDTAPPVKTHHERVLGLISYIGCGFSFAGLVLTIITIVIFKDLRTKSPTQILLNFCIALSLTLIVFLSAAERSKTSSVKTCRAAAVALHYFILVTFMWMAAEAYNMYLLFVKVLPSFTPRFITTCCIVAWGIPAVIVAITFGVANEKYGDEKYCRLYGLPFIVSFLVPVLTILVGNSVAFVLIFRSLLTAGSKVTTDRKVTGFQQARQGLAIMVLLGLTWLFGILAVEDAKEVFQYLFCIFNSLQGFFVFVFYCLLSSTTRHRYKQSLKAKTQSTKSVKESHVTSDMESSSKKKNFALTKKKEKAEPTVIFKPMATNASQNRLITNFHPGSAVNLVILQENGEYNVSAFQSSTD